MAIDGEGSVTSTSKEHIAITTSPSTPESMTIDPNTTSSSSESTIQTDIQSEERMGPEQTVGPVDLQPEQRVQPANPSLDTNIQRTHLPPGIHPPVPIGMTSV